MTIEPDTKDWTWVLEARCPECGYLAADVPAVDVARRVRATVPVYAEALAAPTAARRPSPAVWSPLEYACHVRDVHRLYTERLALMLADDDPRFANWDQDETAVAERYDLQDRAAVAVELAGAAEVMAAAFDGVTADQWRRTGVRSDGAHFTVDSFARYFLHDVEHHAWDITGRPAGSWL
jgi:hypothetical protein